MLFNNTHSFKFLCYFFIGWAFRAISDFAQCKDIKHCQFLIV